MLQTTLRSIKRSISSRLAAVGMAPASSRIAELQKTIDEERSRMPQMMNAVAVNTVLHSSADSFFDCLLNGVEIALPHYTLRTMMHCIHAGMYGRLTVLVETGHMEWLRQKLRPGDVFLDVGASTGAMTLPIAKTIPNVKIVAFEPNRVANRVLRNTLRQNQIVDVEVQDVAVSDASGTATFAELGLDPTGHTPWFPESSTIVTPQIHGGLPHVAATYDVPTVTLDHFVAGRPELNRVRAVKIDVEGFETHVVRGARELFGRAHPYMAIDIHADPFGKGTTEAAVRSLLDPLGYRFERMDHVLLCNPPQA